MRALLAIVLYALAALAGLAAGYYATAPGNAAQRARAREDRRAYHQAVQREFAEMEAASAFLDAEARRAEARAAAAQAKARL